MSNEPKCVYIKTDVGYAQITYAEFCRIRNTTENYKASHWFIPVQGVLLEVPKDAYKAFYREKERERYLRKLDSALFLCNLDLATKIDRSVNLDKVVFNASQMKDPQHKWRQALPVTVGAV